MKHKFLFMIFFLLTFTNSKGSQMAQAKSEDSVKIHYTGKLDDGTVFDTSEKREPLEFKIGDKKVIPGFEKAVVGMTVGESKTVKIPAAEAYGPHRKEMVATLPKTNIPQNVEPKIGQQLQVQQKNGQKIVVTIVGLTDTEITLDANHPLAGKDLTFDLKLVEIVK